MRNQSSLCSNELLNNITATKNLAGQVECAFAIPVSNYPMIVRSGASSGHYFNGRVERIGWSGVARDLRHVDLHIKPK
jgi:hypothetical protein